MLLHISELPQDMARAACAVFATGNTQSGLLCPECAGGTSHERSVSMWLRDARIAVAKCWRAKCGHSLEVVGDPSLVLTEVSPAKWEPRRLQRVRAISQDLLLYVERRYGLRAPTLARYGVTQADTATKDPRIVIPVYSPSGSMRGQVLRLACYGKRVKKAITQLLPGELALAWFRVPDAPGPVVVVEDALSAMRLAQLGRSAASLLGVNVSQEKVRELLDIAGKSGMLLCLDADATARAVNLCRRYGIDVRRIARDFKDSPDIEIINAIAK